MKYTFPPTYGFECILYQHMKAGENENITN